MHISQANKPPFLKGGGKMGEQTRNFNWSTSSLGVIEQWPYSLRTTVSNILWSGQPALAFWGQDFICFYNDAVMPSLRGDIHPSVGRKAKDIWKNGWDTVGPVLQSVLATGTSVTVKDQPVFFLPNSGIEDVCWTSIFSLIQDDDGEPGGVLVFCIETTKDVVGRKATKLSEDKLRSIIAAAPVAIGLFVGRDLIIESPNQAFIDIVGKGPSIVGKPLREAMPELTTEGQPFLKILDDVFTNGKPFTSPASLVRITQNGVLNDNYYNISYVPLFNAEGDVYAILDVAVDVTEQVKAQQAVSESESRFRNLVMQAPAAMAVFRGERYITEIANDSYLQLVDKKASDFLGIPLFESLPHVRPFIESIVGDVVRTGKPFYGREFEVILDRNGVKESGFFNFVYSPLYESDGKANGFIVVAHEVTEQVHARHELAESRAALEIQVQLRTEELATTNEELQATNEELAVINEELSDSTLRLSRSNDELRQFAYAASHDLQEPLRKIRTFADRLLHVDGIPEMGRKLSLKIAESSERMSSLVNSLLEFSHIAESQRPFEQVDLTTLVGDILKDFEYTIEEKNATIQCNDLPVIDASRLQMQQLFGNLISNALKFSRPDVRPNIVIQGKLVDAKSVKEYIDRPNQLQYVHLSVADNGIGFEMQYVNQIFEIFRRLHTQDTYKGSGIGLALCKKIVLNHKGYIKAESTVGEGTTFHIILPVG
jgi:signal transduction histidine kinase